MAALHIFGKKKPPVPQTKSARAKTSEPAKTTVRSLAKGQIVRPHITEKATDLGSKNNQFVFVVQTRATKNDIAKDVQEMYGVTVENVRIIRVHPKSIRFGRTQGTKKGYKKAIVKIKQGQTIEILPT